MAKPDARLGRRGQTGIHAARRVYPTSTTAIAVSDNLGKCASKSVFIGIISRYVLSGAIRAFVANGLFVAKDRRFFLKLRNQKNEL